MYVLTLSRSEEREVSQELRITFPWSHSFLDLKIVFQNFKNNDKYLYLHPEDISYKQSIEKYHNHSDHVPAIVYVVHLSIPVQTNMSNVSAHGHSFARFKGFA